jgi:moderate conductance mechanosensitive channel
MASLSIEEAFSALWKNIESYFGGLGSAGLALNAGLSVLLVVAAAILSFVISAALRTLGRKITAFAAADPSKHASTSIRAIEKVALMAVWIVGLFIVLGIWGLNVWGWVLGPGAPLASSLVRSALVVVAAVVAWEVAIRAIEAAFQTAANNAETPRRAAQLRSLAPMLRGAVRTVITVFAVLIIISQFGVEIGPLLAGAGVVGIAIGFGAQTLVKDYLTGFSLILEDIVSVGDIVRIGDSGGLVEMMTLRTIRLRDFDGTLHVIPYSEAQIVHNLTKTFSYYVFELPISYDSDIDKALELMGTIGRELQAEPEFKDKILSPIEVVGVDSLADSAVILKARIKTAPIQQWTVGREYNKRIKLAFDAAGVEIPVPHLKLQLSDRALEVLGT